MILFDPDQFAFAFQYVPALFRSWDVPLDSPLKEIHDSQRPSHPKTVLDGYRAR